MMEAVTLQLYEITILLLCALIGSIISTKLGQSTLLGYIIVGMLIGPNIHISILGFEYNGLIGKDESMEQIIYLFSEIGVMLLLFFVGLDFSLKRLKNARNPAIILALSDVGVMLFAGFILGAVFAWPIQDTFFLAGIIGMSSVAVTAKVIEKMKIERETRDTLIGMMLIEDFLSIIMVIIAASFINNSTSNDLFMVITGLIVIFVFFLLLYAYIVPAILKRISHIQESEIMALFGITMVFVGGIIGIPFGISPIIGAFFAGLAFSETKLKYEFDTHITSFKNIFVAMFFLGFGLMISPSGFVTNFNMIVCAIAGIIIGEFILLSSIAYLIGLKNTDALFIGVGALPRSEESVIFANIGSNLKMSNGEPVLVHGASLYPLTGAICLITTILCSLLIKSYRKISAVIKSILPAYMKYSGAVVARTLKRTVFPRTVPIYRIEKKVALTLILFLAVFIIQIITGDFIHALFVFVLTPVVVVYLAHKIHHMVAPIIKHTNYSNLGMRRKLTTLIEISVDAVVVLSFLLLYVVSATWRYTWVFSFFFAFSALLIINIVMYILYRETTREVLQKNVIIVVRRHTQ
jgi:CPA2 family monovalent cation:H+ antiporter-2